MPSQQLEIAIQLLRRLTQGMSGLEVFRDTFESAAARLPVAPDVSREPVDAGGVPGEWVTTPQSQDDRVLFYLHGGAYSTCSVTTHRDLIARLTRAARARALGINYRLAPEHPFPAAIEDATASYRWLLSTGIEPARIALAGDSAGGGLTVATLVALRDAGDPLPAAAACLSPWVDLEVTGESMVSRAEMDPVVQREPARLAAGVYLAGADPRTPLASPIYADLRGLPPMLIQAGDAETLLGDATRLADRARAAGVEVELEVWDGMFHVWQAWAFLLPEGQQAIERIGEFVRSRIP
ncbi:MAG: alpha/beta hydrolase [Chloroflexi bacterium]|nr:alpha/beta hydrolase [Chloroflexota bacterium]